ncbi:hypothetical protein C2I18_02465 [Paenibacillus sp. PK3_47]|uniref:hypothetical protein n=1 Tax=Paenibacillus sp. PK3_47 TaxID=2072642 RepID=UPI00201E3968|nr:hypothetical protein [Paenibacillus sp. PK3_47]UQZ32518.1 hypothetical protein C2I18_02465 [Paenibacillus sp. PK3_47]
MSDKLEDYKTRMAALQERGELSQEADSLMKEMLEELAELNRSNKALRRVILKNGQGSAMSTRLRDALYE